MNLIKTIIAFIYLISDSQNAQNEEQINCEEVSETLMLSVINERLSEGRQLVLKLSGDLSLYKSSHSESIWARINEDIKYLRQHLLDILRPIEDNSLSNITHDHMESDAIANAKTAADVLIGEFGVIVKRIQIERNLANKSIRLYNGRDIPIIGLGLGGFHAGGVPQNDVVVRMIRDAIDEGYRHFDTAYSYGNEETIGQTIAQVISEGEVTREQLFITTKLNASQMGRQNASDGVRLALSKLKTTFLDLVLIHQPVGDYINGWIGLEDSVNEGLVRSIGVSNFGFDQLNDILRVATIKPVINQFKSHPGLSQRELIAFCDKNGIAVTAHSPLGHGKLVNDSAFVKIGEKYDKSGAQVILRWHIQRGLSVIPKSTKRLRMRENLQLFDFNLSDDDMKTIDNYV